MTVPYRLLNGVGNKPDADKFMANWDYLEAIARGSFLLNGGFEAWNAGTSFTNPADGTTLSDNWVLSKTGTSAPTVNVARESSIIDGGVYSLKATITGAGSSDCMWALQQTTPLPLRFKTQTIILGVKVYASTGSKIRLKIVDGVSTVYSSYHTGDASWQLLQAAITVDATPTSIVASVEVTADFTGIIYVDSGYIYAIPLQMGSAARELLEYSTLYSGYLELAGGTMSGNIAMGNNKVTGMAAASGNGEAVRYEQALLLAAGGTISAAMDIAWGGITLTLGADNSAATRTNSTTKNGRIAGYHYTNAQPGVCILLSSSTSTDNIVSIGGGASALNSATIVRFYDGANTTTTTGTIRLVLAGTAFDPQGGGTVSSGTAADYWGDLSYKTLTDRGCLPFCDDGVELADGSVVSDLMALCLIKKHPKKLTIHGLPMLDYKSFPKKAYRKAEIDGRLLDRDENDEPFCLDKEDGHVKPASDGIEMTMMFGVFIGAFKEIDKRLTKLEEAKA